MQGVFLSIHYLEPNVSANSSFFDIQQIAQTIDI